MALNEGIDLEAQGCQFSDMAFRAALINENRFSGFSVESLAKEFLEENERKVHPCGVKPEDFHRVSAGEIALRAESDAYLHWRLKEATDPMIKEQDLGKVLQLENDLIPAVTYMERNGAKLDRPKLERWSKEARQIYEDMYLKIYKEVGFKVNPNSGPEVQKLFDYLHLSYPRTEEGTGSFEAKFLKSVPHPVVQMVLKARKMDSLRSKYIDKYLKAIGSGDILRYSLHQLRGDEYGTVSGRFACANVNIQQVMKASRQIKALGPDYVIRELFIPEHGKLWLSADADQIEFRLFAHYANSDHLNRAYAADPHVDFHNFVMSMIQAVIANFSRDHAKGINFGKLYGMGKAKMRRELGLDDNDEQRRLADMLFEAYDAEFPEAKRLMNAASRAAEERGWVKTYLGRRAHFPAKERLHSALNRVIQGTAADVMKLKILELYKAREYTQFLMRMTVHDEVDGDIPDISYKDRVAEVLNSQALPLRIPILWGIDTGENWKLDAA
jgi:DNA polymerase-1